MKDVGRLRPYVVTAEVPGPGKVLISEWPAACQRMVEPTQLRVKNSGKGLGKGK